MIRGVTTLNNQKEVLVIHGYQVTISQSGDVLLGSRNEAIVNLARELYWRNPSTIEVMLFMGGWDPGPSKQKKTVGEMMREILIHSKDPIPLYQTAVDPTNPPRDTIEEIDRALEVLNSWQEGVVLGKNIRVRSVCLASRAIGVMWYWLWRGKPHVPHVAWEWSNWWDWGIELLLLLLRLLDPTGWSPWTKWTRRKRGQ